MLDVFTDYSAFTALAPSIQVLVLVISAGAAYVAVKLAVAFLLWCLCLARGS